MTGVPAALAAALQELPQRQAFESTSVRSLKVQRGDLRFAAPVPGSDATARLVLVISSASDLEFAEVLLAHTAAEMAGAVDAVLSPSLSGAPYPVVIQTDLRGAVWTLQLGPAVGRLEESTIRALSASDAPIAGTSDGLSHGLRLAGPADPRWSFKTGEGAEFRSLTADCTGALLDEGVWQVEPGLLRPDLLDLADDPSALVAELVHWVATRRLRHERPVTALWAALFVFTTVTLSGLAAFLFLLVITWRRR